MRVYWKGGFFTNASLAIVNRRLVQALIDRGNIEITIGTDPIVPDTLPPEFRSLATRATSGYDGADISVVHEFPPHFAAPADSRYVHIQPWEFGSMPREWYDKLHDDCDDFWVHSDFNRNVLIDDGFPSDRLAVIPHGVDTRVFNPNGPKIRTSGPAFRFLFVGGTIERKGIDVLINAYHRAFRPNDNVILMIKDVNTTTFYRGHTRGAEIQALTQRTDVPRIEYVDGIFPDEAMAQLYRAADCLVLPYRGEGFGLPVLEAMACGKPVIVTDGGATDDFVDESVGWRIPSRRGRLLSDNIPTMREASQLEPQLDALIEILRAVYAQAGEVQKRGMAAAERASAWTWDRSGAIAEQRLFQISERPGVPVNGRAIRYRDPLVYELNVFGSSKLDGILLELFARLGVAEPTFVELTDGAPIAAAPVLARGMRWRGLVFERNPGSFPGVKTSYAESPRTKFFFQPFSAATVPETVRLNGMKDGFDLLSLGCGDAIELLRSLSSFHPRVVVCDAKAASLVQTVASELGYTSAARETSRGDALFVRSDLGERAGFEASIAASSGSITR